MDFTQGINNNFERNMECNNPTTEETDMTKLLNSLIRLDNSFNSLLWQFLLVPNYDDEEDKEEMDDLYQTFFDNLKLSAELMIQLFNKNTINYKDNDFIELLEKKFKDSKEAYDTVIVKTTQDIEVEYQKNIKLLNDVYFAYVYILHNLNSLIETYNKQHINATIKMIDNIPEPISLESFYDKNIEWVLKNFITSMKVFENLTSLC